MELKFLHLFQPTNQNKPLGGRYKIISQLGAGGFGHTFLAQDLHLPGHPQCVVKQLKPQANDASSLETARRLFDIEAQVLYELGNHDQIPRLLAHFEDEREFYLAQELIEGELLTQELVGGQPWSDARVVALLQDILQVLAFVHQQQVIHRDIKPSNLIRRQRDGKIVLIDFGAVKQVSTQVVNRKTGQTKTISIGTQGYTPKEQLGGNPRYSSDIYAVGIVGIQALTGIHPRRLREDSETGEINWRTSAPQVSSELAAILDRMVRYDFRVRYPTATEALEALQSLPRTLLGSLPLPDYTSATTAAAPEVPSSQELQPPSLASESTGSEMGLSSTNIWMPSQQSVAPQPSSSRVGSAEFLTVAAPEVASSKELQPPSLASESTGSEMGQSSTNIWTPSQQSVSPQPSSSRVGAAESLATSQSSLSSGNSTPTPTASGLSQQRFPWAILAALGAVGVTFLITKTALSPQLVSQTPSIRRMSVESPPASPIDKPTPPSPISSPTESPVASPVKDSTVPSPTSSPLPSPSATSTGKPVTPSLVTPTPKTQAPPVPAPVVAKPAPTPAQPPAAIATPSRPEPQASELLSQADRLRQAGQYQKAIDLYDQAIARKPSAEAYWGRCYSLNSIQQPAEALASCNQALALNPNYPEALWSKGNALDQQQRPADALKLYEQVTALKPDFTEAWNNQGVALLRLGRATEAVAALDKATTLNPSFANAWANRGAALWELGDFNKAIASIDKALEIQPDNKDAINLRQLAREKLGR